MRKVFVVLLVALMSVAPGLGVLHWAVSAPEGGGFHADAVSAASPNYRIFTEADLKSMKSITGEVLGGHYTCQKNSDPYSYFEQDWKGVDLSYLLEQEVGIKADTTGIKIIAADGYAITLSPAEMRGNGNPDGLKTLLGYLRGGESTYTPPNLEGNMEGTGTFPSVAPAEPNVMLDENEGPVSGWCCRSSAIGPDARNENYNPRGGGSANWQKSVRQVRAIEVQPLQPGIPPIDTRALPPNQVVVYGNILNRHTFTVDQLKTINPVSAPYDWKNKADITGTAACTGITVEYLLDKVLGLQDTAATMRFYASDGFSGKRDYTLEEMRQDWPGGVKMLLAWDVDGELGVEPGDGPIEFIKPQEGSADTNKSKWVKNLRNIHVGADSDADKPDPAQIPSDRIIVSGLVDAGNIPDEWFLAEGCTGYGFEEWILIQNPNPWKTKLIVDYMIEGEMGPVTLNYDVQAMSRFSINVAAQPGVGADRNVSARVEGYHGDSIVAERAMYWGGRDGGHLLRRHPAAPETVTLAEGATAAPSRPGAAGAEPRGLPRSPWTWS